MLAPSQLRQTHSSTVHLRLRLYIILSTLYFYLWSRFIFEEFHLWNNEPNKQGWNVYCREDCLREFCTPSCWRGNNLQEAHTTGTNSVHTANSLAFFETCSSKLIYFSWASQILPRLLCESIATPTDNAGYKTSLDSFNKQINIVLLFRRCRGEGEIVWKPVWKAVYVRESYRIEASALFSWQPGCEMRTLENWFLFFSMQEKL